MISTNGAEDTVIPAVCTICGKSFPLDTATGSRETRNCTNVLCGANGRFQAIALHVSQLVLGEIVPLNKHPVNRDIRIIGLSDSPVMRNHLKNRYDYLNTYFHTEPFFGHMRS